MVGDILQPTHLLFILVVALLVLGPKRLPEVGRTLGSGLRDFRQAINGESTHHDEHEPHAYVETEPDVDTGPAFADESATAPVDDHTVEDDVDEPAWTPEPEVDPGPAFAAESEPESTTTETADASDHESASPEPDAQAVPQRTATASSSGFASALARSRQRADDGESADDE